MQEASDALVLAIDWYSANYSKSNCFHSIHISLPVIALPFEGEHFRFACERRQGQTRLATCADALCLRVADHQFLEGVHEVSLFLRGPMVET